MVAYKTSKDYKHLIELLNKGVEVVCFYTYDWSMPRPEEKQENYEPMMVTDVCTAKLMNEGSKYEQYVISCRGTQFISYWIHDFPYTYTFEELLKARDIEYIEPDNIQ